MQTCIVREHHSSDDETAHRGARLESCIGPEISAWEQHILHRSTSVERLLSARVWKGYCLQVLTPGDEKRGERVKVFEQLSVSGQASAEH